MRGGSCVSPSRVAPTTSGSAISDITMPAMRNDCPSEPSGGALREEAEEALREDQQAEQREHDARHAGEHLDRRVDGAREPRWARVLGQPGRDRRRPIGAAISVPIAVTRSVPSIGSRKPPLRVWWIAPDAGEVQSRLGRR